MEERFRSDSSGCSKNDTGLDSIFQDQTPSCWATTEVIRSLDPTTAAWRTEATPSYEDHIPICTNNVLILHVLAFIISLVGLAGNASVLWFLGFRMRRNAFYTYILNLAATDFLFLCLAITSFLLEVTEVSLNIIISTFLATGTIFFYIADVSMISAISVERCLSVLWPIWYHCHRPKHTSAVICALLWALSMFLTILFVVICAFYDKILTDCKKVGFTIIAWLVLLSVVLSGSSLALLGRMLCGSQKKPLTRLYVTILLTVLVFLFCGLPYGAHMFLLFWIRGDPHTMFCLYVVSVVLSCVNSSANPIIYFFVGSFRQRLQGQNLKMVFERALQDTPEEGECGSSLSHGALEMSGSRVEQG